MAIKYGFFDSVDGDRKYSAEDIGRYLQGIVSSGVYPDNTTGLVVLASGGLQVEVQPGRAMLHYHYMENDEPLTLTLSGGSTMDRIDAIVARLDMERRVCEIAVKQGTPATTPAAPTMLRTDNTKEYMLASVYVTKLSTLISQEDITDTRHDNDVCGWVSGLLDQGAVNVPAPSLSKALMIPTVNEHGTGYELMPTDTTLSYDGAVADAAAVGAALAEKAPLIGIGTYTGNLDDYETLKNTVCWVNGASVSNSPSTAYGIVATWGEGSGAGVQYFITTNRNVAMRMRYNSTWSEWEWENPPMEPGYAYRTTERYRGYVVYTTLTNVGYLASSGQKTATVLNSSTINGRSYEVVSCNGVATDGTYPCNFPIYGSTGVQAYDYPTKTSTTLTITVQSMQDMSSYAAKYVTKCIFTS